MIIVDANVLLYAYDPASRGHRDCLAWLEAALNGDQPVGFPWQTLLAFLRIATNDKVYEQPIAIGEAVKIVSELLDCPNARLVEPSADYWSVLSNQLCDAQVHGPLVTDAALASLALEHGASLCTTDRDFRRFRRLKVFDLLA